MRRDIKDIMHKLGSRGEEASYLVIDLEATCDRSGFPRNQMEIIEIGAVLVDGRTLAPRREFQSFVRPVRRRTLTPFCTGLTSITQDMVDGAPTFPEALIALEDFLDGEDFLFCSWGAYDLGQFRQDAAHHGVSLPLGDRHLNLKAAFADRTDGRRCGMKGALRRAGIPLDGTHHRGIDDARNIAKLLPWCLGHAKLKR